METLVMKKNPTWSLVISAMALTACLVGCATPQTPFDPGRVNHVVLITLEDPSEAEALQTDCDTMLSTIPSVTVYACGPHVETGRSKAVEADYTLGLLVCFRDMAGYSAYLEHPGHVALLEKWKSRFSALTIYDVGNAPITE